MGKTKQLNPEIFKAQQVINCVDYTLEEMASDIFTNAKHYANENDCIITVSCCSKQCLCLRSLTS